MTTCRGKPIEPLRSTLALNMPQEEFNYPIYNYSLYLTSSGVRTNRGPVFLALLFGHFDLANQAFDTPTAGPIECPAIACGCLVLDYSYYLVLGVNGLPSSKAWRGITVQHNPIMLFISQNSIKILASSPNTHI